MELRRADTIADDIEEQIFTGAFDDGDRLDEIRLAAQYGVSRTPIREALMRLVSSGLAEQQPRRGVFVHQPGPVELVDMFETMAELEAGCARLAAMRISDAALAELTATNARCQTAVEQGDTKGYYHENEGFHQIIYRETGNAFLEKQTLQLQRRLKPYRRLQLRLRGRLLQSMDEHLAIVAALSDGNADVAASVVRAHVVVQGEKFHHLMASLKSARSRKA